jgi:uncharacterized protein YgiM (DUF1202 family)
MNATTQYAALSAFLTMAAIGLAGLGFAVAGETFARGGSRLKVPTVEFAEHGPRDPQSALLGAKPDAIARKLADMQEWVEVIDSVNMRQGPSSANPVIKVQLAGTKLRVASRDRRWVEVVTPETGDTGWVFGKHVKPIPSEQRRADAAKSTIR